MPETTKDANSIAEQLQKGLKMVNDGPQAMPEILGEVLQQGQAIVKSVSSDFPEFYGFMSARTVFSVDKQGKVQTRTLKWLEEPHVAEVKANGDIKPMAFSLPPEVKVDGVVGAFPLNMGLVVISGDTGVGKSTFIRALSTLLAVRRLQAVEPDDFAEDAFEQTCFSSADTALVSAIIHTLTADSTTLHVIDSLRAPVFETTGAAGGKGVIMPFFTQLTRVSNQLARAGMTVVATVNPMDDDPAFVTAFLSKLSAATPTAILLKSYRREAGLHRFTGTISSRPTRVKRNFSFEVPISGQPVTVTPSGLLMEISFEPADSGLHLGSILDQNTLLEANREA